MAKKTTSGGKAASTKKATSTKKSAGAGSKKSSAKKAAAAPKLSAAEKKLVAEIQELLGKLDQQGLEFIKRQAEVLAATGELARSREEALRAIEKVSTSEPAPAVRPVEPPPPAVAIEQKQDNAFFIRTYGRKIFFNRQEMRQLARVAHAADSPADGARRLHVWLKRERGDFLIDTDIAGPGDPALKLLWEQIVSTYAAPQ